MNYRALALGAAIGFLAALVPSCSSGSGTGNCSSANCSTCCDSTGKCVGSGNNKLNTTCGTAGKACADCTKTTGASCDATSFTCKGGTGGGGGGSAGGGTNGGGGGTGTGGGMVCNTDCGPNTCNPCMNGCCSAKICVPFSAQTPTNCGKTGVACAMCPAATPTCSITGTTAGTCIPSGPAGAGIGDACSADTDCTGVDTALMGTNGEMGGDAICHKAEAQIVLPLALANGAPYPAGYCTRRCDVDGECGDGNYCGFYLGSLGEATNICAKGCDVDTDCKDSTTHMVRPGYGCVIISSTASPAGICLPNLPDAGFQFFDAGVGIATSTLGKDCTQDTDCQTETGYGVCRKSMGMLADGGMGPTGFTSGFCTADCTMAVSDGWCMGLDQNSGGDGGAWCLPQYFTLTDFSAQNPITDWNCEQGCSANPNSCKTGYVCVANLIWNTPGPNCEPDCTLPSDCSDVGGCLSTQGCFNATSVPCDALPDGGGTHTCKFAP